MPIVLRQPARPPTSPSSPPGGGGTPTRREATAAARRRGGSAKGRRPLHPFTPLILNGLAYVSTDLGGVTTAGLVHTIWDRELAVEQWILFDANNESIVFAFDSLQFGRAAYSLDLLTERCPDRLPWPRVQRPVDEAMTYWEGLYSGTDLTADAFRQGALQALSASTTFRYVCTTILRQTTLPPSLQETYPSSDNSPRRWEEVVYNAPLDPASRKLHVYGEGEGPEGSLPSGERYTPSRMHMAWRSSGILLPPEYSTFAKALTNPADANADAWVKRMAGSVFKSSTDRYYALGAVKLFTAAEFKKLKSVPVM